MPLLGEDLTDRADVVLVGKVKSAVATQKEGPATAKVEVIEILKGKNVGREIEVGFTKSEMIECPSPTQLQVNEQYVLFLTDSPNGYALVNPYDGAWRLTPEKEKKARELVKQDAKYDELFKYVQVSLKIEKPDLMPGEKPNLTFSVTNMGKEQIAIKGEVARGDGRIHLEGWMNLILEKLRNGKVYESIKLGGVHDWKTPDLIIPAGATLKWTAKFDWADYGSSPGTYRLKWKLGKVISEPVSYRMADAPSDVDTLLISDVTHLIKCNNPEVVVKDLKELIKNIDYARKTFGRRFWELEEVEIGPRDVGLLVRIYSGSAVGNDYYLLYSIVDKNLELIGEFRGEEFKIIFDRISNGFYDLYTLWHMGANGGPFDYYRWNGSRYEVYKSGDTSK